MPYLIGITGGSASGKTYLLRCLQEAIPSGKVTFISMDHYYKDIEYLPKGADGRINFDHPEAIDHEKFYRDLKGLCAGLPATQREYTFNSPNSASRLLIFEPAPILIVEGLFLFYWAPIRELFDLRVFIEVDEPYRFLRRLHRDQKERGCASEAVTHQYLTQVLPAYRQFVEPLRYFAHIIIQNHWEGDLLPALRLLLDHIRNVLEKGGR
ncbi:MAG: uridine kinase [Bacteroidia bacterium]|nr:uridine kinase [Bacteroidia bacterium]MDW8015754.1 uridine kinase [Bacteroidia bacterium]